MTDEHLRRTVAGLHQQVTALASIVGVLTAALRQAGLMSDRMEALLASGLAESAMAQSEQAGAEWEHVVDAVQKVATAAARNESSAEI